MMAAYSTALLIPCYNFRAERVVQVQLDVTSRLRAPARIQPDSSLLRLLQQVQRILKAPALVRSQRLVHILHQLDLRRRGVTFAVERTRSLDHHGIYWRLAQHVAQFVEIAVVELVVVAEPGARTQHLRPAIDIVRRTVVAHGCLSDES